MAIPEGLSTTPFAPRYADRVEEWIDVYGNAVPLAIGDPAEEYEAIRTAVGASEYSMLYKWHVEGADAVAAVDAVFSRSVKGLGAGRIAYGVVVDADGMMLDDVTVAVLAPDHVVVTGGNPATRQSLAASRARRDHGHRTPRRVRRPDPAGPAQPRRPPAPHPRRRVQRRVPLLHLPARRPRRGHPRTGEPARVHRRARLRDPGPAGAGARRCGTRSSRPGRTWRSGPSARSPC